MWRRTQPHPTSAARLRSRDLLAKFVQLLCVALTLADTHDPPDVARTMDGAAKQHMETTMRAMTDKKPVPEIDFTLHTMEDGTQVSTQERVCKGTSGPSCGAATAHTRRCPSTSDESSHRRAVLLARRP